MVTVIDRLSEEHLKLWRKACAERDAVSYNPEAFDPKSTIAFFQDYYRLAGQLAAIYEIDFAADWAISPYTGIIYYED